MYKITTYLITLLCFFGTAFYTGSLYAQQVGINTTNPASGALLDVSGSDKGILLPRIPLTGTNDNSTITPGMTTGLMIYNTATAGASPYEVTPGFYYWNGAQWSRLFDQGYTLHYNQSSETQFSALSPNTFSVVDGLDTGVTPLTVPYSGTYQIIVKANYSAGDLSSTSSDAAGEASVQLRMQTNLLTWTNLTERYVYSASKRILTNSVHNLGQNVTIIENVELDALNTYRFQVRAREWRRVNTIGAGYIGKDTSGMPGASGNNTAKRGTMSITFIREN